MLAVYKDDRPLLLAVADFIIGIGGSSARGAGDLAAHMLPGIVEAGDGWHDREPCPSLGYPVPAKPCSTPECLWLRILQFGRSPPGGAVKFEPDDFIFLISNSDLHPYNCLQSRQA